ncbi:hypothetical protein [Streptomyces sp. NBC_00829]|uniref:hypothetical protein n=1 Tax=Streptomyces sp. NBC_00829 TaxID=2903679 RepID=UPI00386BC906|nr:hypothetical protein OG293_33030 [Streptomyces sp. NBC_00829]
MNAELWTLAGVIVGAAGALGAATLTSRAARRAPLATHRRDKRREAYAAFVGVATELAIAAEPHASSGFRINSVAPNPEEWVQELNTIRRRLLAAYPLVQLEGPQEVERSGMAVMNAALVLVMAADNVALADVPPAMQVSGEVQKLSDVVATFLVDCQTALRI